MFVLPGLLALFLGYIYLHGENQELEKNNFATEQKTNALKGEIYRLKQALSQRDAKLNYLTDPGLERLKLSAGDHSRAIWLFYRKENQSWYAEMSHAPILDEGLNYRLLIDGTEVGAFERIADTVGLQKIGRQPPGEKLRVKSARRGEDELIETLYELDLSSEGI
jgi:hypothetical protein